MKGIFVEHCLEHITFAQCQNVLKDLYRILKTNGIIRVIIPDAELYIDLYQKGKKGENVSFPYVSEEDIKNGDLHTEEDVFDAVEQLLKK